MKKIDKSDIIGLALSAGVGAVTALIYFAGKFGGKAAAYDECSNMLMDLVDACEKIETKE